MVRSVNFPLGVYFQYKFIKIGTDTTLTWEADPNREYTVPSDCNTSPVLSGPWQYPPVSTSAAVAIAATSTTAQASAVVTSQPTYCPNTPTTRNCWADGFDINTDFDNHWPTTGRTVSYTFEITNTTLAPDGVSRPVFAINGQYPGPTIYADWGDMISVTVINKLQDNGTTIHFHGVRQWHSNTQDGVPGLTECPIAPGTTRTYTFQATQFGTSWYHSHFSCQYGDGILGPIVIQGPATANYDIDVGPLPITDWYYPTVNYHASITEHTNGSPPVADNALINGTMTSSSGGAYALTKLTTGKRHRLRLINTSVDNHFMVSLDGHQIEVITADFVPIVPYNTTWIMLGIGQRYDVIITADQAPGNYWFRAEVQDGCGANANNKNIKSMFAYPGHENETPISTGSGYTGRCTDETQLVPHWNSYVPPKAGFAEPTFFGTALNQSTAADGTLTLYWQVNGSSLNIQWDKPTLQYVQESNTSYPSGANVVETATEGQWTYWVIQEVPGTPYNVNVPHPLHLHGHDFFILGTGTDTWDAKFSQNLNYNNPPRRDTAMLPSNGWIVLAWQTDNPGAWLFHCHIAWHSDEGLGVQFLEAADQMQSVNPIGTEFDQQCQAWHDFYPVHASYLKHDSGV
ncbi:hypothetical protein AMS68_005539 [Peltaster fructicola]|uniref:laccase n=1 Tax=Peltaster fructicola TaxID=286661 RepID=A0A6H0XZ23_9PEZI|nr:hypothetical protein AMS68_005539 [Peltaster fructicola]